MHFDLQGEYRRKQRVGNVTDWNTQRSYGTHSLAPITHALSLCLSSSPSHACVSRAQVGEGDAAERDDIKRQFLAWLTNQFRRPTSAERSVLVSSYALAGVLRSPAMRKQFAQGVSLLVRPPLVCPALFRLECSC